MPVTLAQAKLNVTDALQLSIIDEFRKSSYLLDNMLFDDAVSPVGGGATLTYGYTRVKTQASAAFRAINSEYTASEVEKERFTVDLKVFGGSYKVDRVIANMGGIINEVEFQARQKIKAAVALFHDTFINGDVGVDANAFDGLNKALTSSVTEFNTTTAIDLSTSAAVDSNYKAFLDLLDEFLLSLDGVPSALLMNDKLFAKMRAVARRALMYSVTKNEFGVDVEYYGSIPMINLGTKPGSANPIIPIDGTAKTTDLYAVRLGIDGVHGVSMNGVQPIVSTLPDFSTAGAVKEGDVEMVAAIAVKATKAAGVFRKIKVTA